MVALIRKNGAYVRYAGKYATDPDLCDCKCRDEPPGSDCASLGDTLNLHIAYCGREWTSTLTFKNEVFGYRVWQTLCDLEWVADCPGDPDIGTVNGQICAVFECLPGEEEEYRLTFGTGCGESGDCNIGGVPSMSPITVQTDPFEVVFQGQMSGNWCDDTPPCYDPVICTVTIP